MAKKQSRSSGPTPTAAQIAKLDREIVELLNRRAEWTQQRAQALGQAPADMTSAAALAAASSNPGPLPTTAVEAVFRELHSGIRAAASPLRVAYLGPEFTYSHLAAVARFGQSAELIPVGTIAAVFEEVERGQAAYGVVPIENSTDGRVADALECFSRVHEMHRSRDSVHRTPPSSAAAGGEDAPARSEPTAYGLQPTASLQICGEAPLRIRHCLLGRGPRSAVRRVCSKPQALSQCRNWLGAHLSGAKLEPAASSAEAAELAAADPATAAIASEQVAAKHGLEILARNIEDNPDNVTRFAIIARHAAERTGRDKTALVFEAPHEPGALADAMAIFKRQRLNLTWIESFPIPRARGRYLFFLEFQGHAADLRAKRAIASLQKKALRLVILGSYAEAELIDGV